MLEDEISTIAEALGDAPVVLIAIPLATAPLPVVLSKSE